MPERTFHHGNLREVLLDAAEQTVRDGGVDALSLRALARQAGVSHGAPRRHFPDRQALLDALAAVGFDRLTRLVHAADEEAGPGYAERFRAVARSYVAFALDDGALMELMFSAKNGQSPAPAVLAAAGGFFAEIQHVLTGGDLADRSPPLAAKRLQLVVVATLQGIATLVSTGRIVPTQIDQIVDDATLVFTGHFAPD